MNHQIEFVTLNDLVDSRHPSRKFVELINIDVLCTKHLSKAQGKSNYKLGFNLEVHKLNQRNKRC